MGRLLRTATRRVVPAYLRFVRPDADRIAAGRTGEISAPPR